MRKLKVFKTGFSDLRKSLRADFSGPEKTTLQLSLFKSCASARLVDAMRSHALQFEGFGKGSEVRVLCHHALEHLLVGHHFGLLSNRMTDGFEQEISNIKSSLVTLERGKHQILRHIQRRQFGRLLHLSSDSV